MIRRHRAGLNQAAKQAQTGPVRFSQWTKEQESDFFGRLKEWEEIVEREYLKSVKDEHFDSVTRKSLNMKGMLDAIPAKVRDRLTHSYQEIIGFNDIIGSGTPLRQIGGGIAPAHKLPIDPSQLVGDSPHPLAFIYNRAFIQGQGTDESPFKLGKNILRSDYLQTLFKGSRTGLPTGNGKKVLVFDTETSGLPYGSVRHGEQHFPDLRQISAVTMTTDSSGKMSAPKLAFDEHFKTSRMAIGHLAADGKSKRMDEVVADQYMGSKGYANKLPGSGDDFVDALRPFLKLIDDADVIVGQNVEFDISQIFSGLTRTAAYQENRGGFRELLDGVRDKAIADGKVRDTLEMARIQLPELGIAREISFAGNRVTTHSLENLMLSTNLPDLLREDLTDDKLLKMLGATKGKGTMHASDVDAQIEAYLFKYLTEGRLKEGAAKADAVGRQIRSAVLKSYAPTPLSNIADISHIDEKLFEAMIDEGNSVFIMGEDGAARLPRGSAADVRALLLGDEAPHASFKVTPLEQEIFSTRRFLDSAEVTDTRAMAMGMDRFRRWARQDEPYEGFFNRFGSLFRRGQRPSDASFAQLQDRAAREGVPFAGLSMPERWLTGALARGSNLEGGGGAMLTGADHRAAAISDDLGISRFVAQTDAYMSKGSGRNISLPLEILEEAEREGVLDSSLTKTLGQTDTAEMLSLSAFETPAGQRQVNLVYNLGDEDQAKALSGWLGSMDLDTEISGRTLADFGFTEDTLDDIVRQIPESGLEHGISVGKLEGKAGDEVYGAMQSFFQGLLRDKDKVPIKVGYMGASEAQDGKRSINVGAAFLDRFTKKQEKVAYTADLVRASARHEDMVKVMANPAAASAVNIAFDRGSPEAIEKGLRIYDAVKKRAPIVGGIAAAVVGGYYLRKRTKEQNNYDVAMSKMETETQTDYDEYRDTMGLPLSQAKRTMDPLATAGVTGNLHRNKTGHHQMGTAGKYSDLYVGAI